MIRFRYQPERSHLGRIFRPIATVFVEHKGIRIELPLYIDSGADISMIPYRFGKALRLERARKDRIKKLKALLGLVSHTLLSDSISFLGEEKLCRGNVNMSG